MSFIPIKVSIIVPVYNVEPYLRRCIDSILAQTFTDFELILVDDGSPDNCPAICDEYVALDNRVKVIHKKNEGQASARNDGLRIASGEYIGFVDSDDTISKSMYKDMVACMEANDADIVVCGIENVDDNGVILNNWQNIEGNHVISKEEIFGEFYTRYYRQLRGSVCNKLYKRQIFDELQFPVGVLYEDSYVLVNTIDRAEKIAFINKNYYIYLSTRNNSTMHYKYSKQSFHSLLFVEKNYLFFSNNLYYGQKNYALEEYLNDFLKHQLMVSLTHKELKGELPVKMPIFRILVNKRICKMKKIVFLMSYFNAKIALKLCKKYFPECIHQYMKNDLNYDCES